MHYKPCKQKYTLYRFKKVAYTNCTTQTRANIEYGTLY